MALIDIVRTGVKIANSVTDSLQSTVSFERCTGTDGFGAKTYAAAVSLKAIVDWKQQQVRTPEGQLTVTRASVLFLDTAALVTATGGNGVSDEDRITLADGTTGPILDMAGFIDAGTTKPVATEVFLG